MVQFYHIYWLMTWMKWRWANRVIWNSRRAELLIISTLSLWACLRGCFMATWYVLFSPARCLFRPSPPSALVRLGVRFTLLFSCSSLLGLSVCSGSRWVIVAGGGWVSVSGLCLCSVKLLFPMKLRSVVPHWGGVGSNGDKCPTAPYITACLPRCRPHCHSLTLPQIS